LFGLYLCVHLLVNATLIQGPVGAHGGPSVFQVQVDKIHSLPFLLAIELSFIFGPLIFHTIYGIYLVINGKPNVGNYGYIKNWFYVLQRISAIALVLFIFFHVGAMYGWFGDTLKFEPHQGAYSSTVRHMMSNPLMWLVVYPLGVIAGTFHLANGFWTAGIAWGLTVSQRAQVRWGWVCLFIFFATTACGFIAIAATFIHRNHDFAAVHL
jgi:succinate dehydrogenase / fumarate reductase cytochrome b subunit